MLATALVCLCLGVAASSLTLQLYLRHEVLTLKRELLPLVRWVVRAETAEIAARLEVSGTRPRLVHDEDAPTVAGKSGLRTVVDFDEAPTRAVGMYPRRRS